MAFSPAIDDFTQRGRNEAAAKLSKNKEVVRAGDQAACPLPTGHNAYQQLHDESLAPSVSLRYACLASLLAADQCLCSS
jgi:hypothetical protein